MYDIAYVDALSFIDIVNIQELNETKFNDRNLDSTGLELKVPLHHDWVINVNTLLCIFG